MRDEPEAKAKKRLAPKLSFQAGKILDSRCRAPRQLKDKGRVRRPGAAAGFLGDVAQSADTAGRWPGTAEQKTRGCIRGLFAPYSEIRRRMRLRYGCGCSSGVEHNLAKVGVEGSNPFARSRFKPLKTDV